MDRLLVDAQDGRGRIVPEAELRSRQKPSVDPSKSRGHGSSSSTTSLWSLMNLLNTGSSGFLGRYHLSFLRTNKRSSAVASGFSLSAVS